MLKENQAQIKIEIRPKRKKKFWPAHRQGKTWDPFGRAFGRNGVAIRVFL